MKFFYSEDHKLILSKTQAISVTYLIGSSWICKESVEGLVHGRWAAHPQPFNVSGTAGFLNLSPDELFVPSLSIDTFLRKPNMQTEAVHVVSLTVCMEAFKKLQGDRLSSIRE